MLYGHFGAQINNLGFSDNHLFLRQFSVGYYGFFKARSLLNSLLVKKLSTILNNVYLPLSFSLGNNSVIPVNKQMGKRGGSTA